MRKVDRAQGLCYVELEMMIFFINQGLCFKVHCLRKGNALTSWAYDHWSNSYVTYFGTFSGNSQQHAWCSAHEQYFHAASVYSPTSARSGESALKCGCVDTAGCW